MLLPIGFICGRYGGKNNKQTTTKVGKEIRIVGMTGKLKTNSPTPMAGNKVARKSLQSKGETTAAEDDKMSIPDDKVAFNHTDKLYNSRGRSNDNHFNLTAKNQFLSSRNSTNKTTAQHFSEREFLFEKPATVSVLREERKLIFPASSAGNITNAAILGKDTIITGETSGKGSAWPDEQSNLKTTNAIEKSKEAFKRILSFGLVTGPDVSTVKFNKASKVGYSIGLLFSYPITSKITMEAGVLWDRKNYYATARYLDTSKLQLPTRRSVSNVNAYCSMVEIPINVKYDLITKQNIFGLFQQAFLLT